jgi:hypothetical protein
MATSITGVKSNPLTLCRKLNIISTVAGVLDVPCRIAEELVISARNVTDKCLFGQTYLRMC